jgi:hypothetical protein
LQFEGPVRRVGVCDTSRTSIATAFADLSAGSGLTPSLIITKYDCIADAIRIICGRMIALTTTGLHATFHCDVVATKTFRRL